MRKGVWILILGVCMYGAGVDGGRIYMSKGCYGCHGTSGEGIGDYPRLACRNAKELLEKLERLKRGIGHTSKRDMMIPFAKVLSLQEMEAVTDFLSRQCGREDEETMSDDLMDDYEP